MACPIVHLAQSIFCCAWNRDCSLLALCPGNEEIHIFRPPSDNSSNWDRLHILKAHSQLVADLDWAPMSDLLVSCSHDKTMWVWDPKGTPWEKQFVMAEPHRAALCVRWSPLENKFAVGTAARSLYFIYYNPETKLWPCSHVRKKHDSSVVSLAWHPNNVLLATGSTDFKVRVLAAFVHHVDTPSTCSGLPHIKDSPPGTVLCEVNLDSSWVHSVVWSSSGRVLACTTHASMVYFLHNRDPNHPITSESYHIAGSVMSPTLPFKAVMCWDEDLFFAGGWDGHVYLLKSKPGGRWTLKRVPSGAPGAINNSRNMGYVGTSGITTSNVALKLEMLKLQTSDKTPPQGSELCPVSGEPDESPPHVNCITSLRPCGVPHFPGGSSGFSSAGLDGRLIFWDATLVLQG